jgi:PAS domain S-box-containing protein
MTISELEQHLEKCTAELAQVNASLRAEVARRKRVEDALRASQKDVRLLYDASGDVLFQISVEPGDSFRFLSVNQAFLDATGLAKEQVVGKRVEDVIPEPSCTLVLGKYKQAIRENKTVRWEETSVYPSGVKVGDVAVTPVLNERGVCTHLVGSVHDITEQVRTKELLQYRLDLEKLISGLSANFINCSLQMIDREITNALQSIAEFAGAVRSSIFLFSDDLTTAYNTHEWCADPADSQIDFLREFPFEQFGSHTTVLQGLDVVIIGRLDDLPLEAKGEREWVKDHGFRPLLFVPMLREGGLYGTVGFYGSVDEEKDWPNDFVRLLEFAADMFVNAIERKRADQALRQARRFTDNLIQTANVMIIGLDEKGNITTFNPAAARITGYLMAELGGRNWFEILVPRERYPHVWDEFQRLLTSDLPQRYENPILTKSGEERIISWSNNRIIEDGKTVGTLSFGIDMTERKRAEEELERHRQELEDLVRDRTEEMRVYANIVYASNELMTHLSVIFN